MAEFVDPDRTVASTIDSAFYRDEAAYARARERIFARAWQWIGDPGRSHHARSFAGSTTSPCCSRATPREGCAACRTSVPSRQHPASRALHRGRTDSLRIPLATLRSFRAQDLHAGVRRSEKLPLGERRPAADTLRNRRGRYSPTRERGTHHFHRLLGEFPMQSP